MADISIEQEIMRRLRQLDERQKQRVLAFVESQLHARTQPTLLEWLTQATAFREELRQMYGPTHFFGVQAMLDDIREEASWPRRS
jgi:hypothetical protein